MAGPTGGIAQRKSRYFAPHQSDRYVGFELKIGEVEIPTYHYFQDFSFEFGADSDWSGNITLFDPDWDYLESIIMRAQEDYGKVKNTEGFLGFGKKKKAITYGGVTFSFGWNDQLAGPYNAAILAYAPAFSHDGVTLELNLTHPTTITRNSEVWTGSWPPNTSASQVVTDLIPHLGGYFKGYVIEPSFPYTAGPIIMPKHHPLTWIKKQFCSLDADKPPISSVRPGVGGYELTIDTNSVLRFHAPGYKGKVIPIGSPGADGKAFVEDRGITRSYVFGKGNMGQVISFSVADLSKFCQILGAGISSGSIVDAKKKGTLQSGASHDGSSDTTAPTKYAEAKKTPGTGARKGRKTRHDPRPYRDKKTLDAMVQARFNTLSESTYGADLEILGDPYLNYNDYLDITILKKNGQEHYTSGVYRVKRVSHKISGGEFTTSLSLEKSSAKDASAAFSKVKPLLKKGAQLRQAQNDELSDYRLAQLADKARK